MSSHPNSRAATAARSHIIELLQDDHTRLKRAYREFQRLDADRNGDLCESIIRRTLHEPPVPHGLVRRAGRELEVRAAEAVNSLRRGARLCRIGRQGAARVSTRSESFRGPSLARR